MIDPTITMQRGDMLEGLEPKKSEIEAEIDNMEQGIHDVVRSFATEGPAGAFKAIFVDHPDLLPKAATTVMSSPHMLGARGGMQSLAAECMNPANCMRMDWRDILINTINSGRELQGKKPITWGQLGPGNYQ